MPDVEDLLAKARTLGEALAAHPVIRDYHAAQQAARNDQAAQKLLRDYQAQLDHIRDLEARQKPVEVSDKHRLKDLETRMAGHESLKNLMRQQVEYVDLMARVNRAMDEPLVRLSHPESTA